MYMQRVMPLVMVLMSGKTQEMYQAIIRHVRRRVQRVTEQR